jgi:hypothetical protein
VDQDPATNLLLFVVNRVWDVRNLMGELYILIEFYGSSRMEWYGIWSIAYLDEMTQNIGLEISKAPSKELVDIVAEYNAIIR